MDIIIIGLGGIGSILVERMARFLNYSNDFKGSHLLLVDGDSYEIKNYERQEFVGFGNKAETKVNDLELKFTNTLFDYKPIFINEVNISTIIKPNDVVFVCVDNHKTRMIISNYCKTLPDVTVFSGGNELVDGNVQIYVRRGGNDLTPDLCSYHPEIANPDDKLPDEMSCEELSQSQPQLYFTNLGVATIMCWAFYNVVVKNQIEKSEVYFDIIRMAADSKVREVRK
jgi:molybdopterin/thiamine biosynthesis adenylyltransferase